MKNSRNINTPRGAALREQWQRHLELWRSSGTTQIAYCKKFSLSRHAFQYWKHQLNKGGPRRFVEIRQTSAADGISRIEILLADGVRICVPQGASAEELRMVLHFLRES